MHVLKPAVKISALVPAARSFYIYGSHLPLKASPSSLYNGPTTEHDIKQEGSGYGPLAS